MANKMSRIIYRMLKYGQLYVDRHRPPPGPLAGTKYLCAWADRKEKYGARLAGEFTVAANGERGWRYRDQHKLIEIRAGRCRRTILSFLAPRRPERWTITDRSNGKPYGHQKKELIGRCNRMS